MRHVLALLLVVCGCDRTGGSKPAIAADADPPAKSAAAPLPSASAGPLPSTAAPLPSASTGDTVSTPLPKVERAAVKTCPARFAVVKLDKAHGMEGRVELTGCPEEEGRLYGAGKAKIALIDAKGAEKNAIVLADGPQHSEKLEVNDLYGTGRPVFFVTVTEPTAGGSNGPITSMYEVDGDKLVQLRVAGKNGGPGGEITLKSSITVHWWLHPARAGRGQDIYLLTAPNSGATTGYRYAFEKGKWVVRSGELKRWTGEHLKDTEAEFP